MIIGIPRESLPGETRVAATPQTVGQLIKLGYSVLVEAGAGDASSFADQAYVDAGAEIGTTAAVWSADVVLKVNAPDDAEIALLKDGATLVSLISPALNPELVEKLATRPITVLSMDSVPRISRAQSLDVLSSMANIAGYRAVVEAAHAFGRFFTGQVTAAGKVPPAKVLVVGAGVAGLAAIGAAGSLGAIVRATDPRPEVADQVASLGGEYLSVANDKAEVSATGYAKEMDDDYKAREAALYAEQCKDVDIIITTALIPGKPAPRIITADMVASMKPGSVIVDMAAANGGNVEGTVKDKSVVTDNGVTIVGYTDFPSRMAAQSSMLYSTNIRHMMADLTPGKDGRIVHNMEDDVIRGATVTHDGAITFPPPPPKIQAIAAQKPKEKPKELTPAERRAQEVAAFKAQTRQQVTLLTLGGALILLAGLYAPASFMSHFIVFVLAVFVGFQVIWNVSHSLHTPLMAVTNAISSIIILGALMQIGSGSFLVILLAALSVFMAGINIFGGFMVTRRMLAMFQKS